MRKIKIAWIVFLVLICMILHLDMLDARADSEMLTYGNLTYKIDSETGTIAIRGCTDKNISSVTIPIEIGGRKVTNIGDYAFMNCDNLQSVTIPEGIKYIGAGAFAYCEKLTGIKIPKSVKKIYKWAFIGCEGLESIQVESGNTVYDSRGNCNAIIESDGDKLIQGCVNTVIPSSVAVIGYSSFDHQTRLKEITIPKGVTDIEEKAFRYCSALQKIKIPSTVTSIGVAAFSNDTELKSVVILDGAVDICRGAFMYCEKLSKFDMGDKAKSIDDYAFLNCTSLTYLWVPSSVETMSYDAFEGCNITIGCLNTFKARDNLVRPNIKYDFKYVLDEKSELVEIDGICNYEYTGKPIKQYIEVKYVDMLMGEGKNYSISYRNNVNAGTASVTITGKGIFVGSITKTFKITKSRLSGDLYKVKISGIKDMQYTGKKCIQRNMVVRYNGYRLKEGRDYSVKYKNNVKSGKATVIITGKNSCTGRIVKTFRILHRKGDVFAVNNLRYKVTRVSSSKSGTVALIGSTYKKGNRRFTSLNIPDVVTSGGVRYKVTSVEKNAFKGYSSLKTIRCGRNITTIGANAFYGCKKVSRMQMLSCKLTGIGKNAFGGWKRKASVKFPAAKRLAYNRLLKKAGMKI